MSSKSSVFPRFFNPEELGPSLKEVSSDLLRVESRDLVARWFHGPAEIDLFLWTDESKKIVKQQLTFYGQVVEWNVTEGTKTGAIIEQEQPQMANGPVKSSETIRFDERPQVQPLGLAMDLIQHAPALTAEERRQIIANFFRGQKHSDLGPEEFLQRYSAWHAGSSSFTVRIYARVLRFLRWLIKPL